MICLFPIYCIKKKIETTNTIKTPEEGEIAADHLLFDLREKKREARRRNKIAKKAGQKWRRFTKNARKIRK